VGGLRRRRRLKSLEAIDRMTRRFLPLAIRSRSSYFVSTETTESKRNELSLAWQTVSMRYNVAIVYIALGLDKNGND
jgi:hypothetical protein